MQSYYFSIYLKSNSWLPYPADPKFGDARDYLFTNSPCSKVADELKAKHWNDATLKQDLAKCMRQHQSVFESRLSEVASATKRTVQI